MDIRKILSLTKFIDNDPDSDVEREEGLTVSKAGPVMLNEQNGGKKKGKKAVEVMAKMNPDDLNIAYIIGETPPKKKVVEYIKLRIQQLLDEDE